MKKRSKNLWIIALILLTFTILPASQVVAIETATELTPNYFLPQLGKTYIYQHQQPNGTVEEFKSMWEKDATGIYTNTLVYNDGAVGFTKYVTENSDVVQIDSGFSVPQSEWSNDPVISGKNIVFKHVTAGSSWTNDYRTKDAWGTVCRHQSNYTFMGFEKMVVMGKEVTAARFNSGQEQTIVSEDPFGAEWSQLPYTAIYNKWYVDGVGLVKSSTVTTDPYTKEQYSVTTTLVDSIDALGITPNKAIEMVCQHIGKTNRLDVFAYQEASVNGLYVVTVTAPQGYPQSGFCGRYYVNPLTGDISR